MSELTQCNYCQLRAIREKAKKDGMRVSVISDRYYVLGGKNVYVSPVDVRPKSLPVSEKKKYFVAWFMTIPGTCMC